MELHLDFNQLTGTIPAFATTNSPLEYFSASFQVQAPSGRLVSAGRARRIVVRVALGDHGQCYRERSCISHDRFTLNVHKRLVPDVMEPQRWICTMHRWAS